MNLFLVLLLVWTIIYGANYFVQHHTAKSLLPTPRGANSFGRRRNFFWDTRTTQIILNKLHLRVQTSAWNSWHDTLSKAVAPRPGSARLRSALTYFYNAGCVMGVLGTAISLGLLLWNCAQAAPPLIHGILAPSSPGPLLKRGAEVIAKADPVIKPIVCLFRRPKTPHHTHGSLRFQG